MFFFSLLQPRSTTNVGNPDSNLASNTDPLVSLARSTTPFCAADIDGLEVKMCQAIIDDDAEQFNALLRNPFIKSWINKHIPEERLQNAALAWFVFDGQRETSVVCRASYFSSLSTFRELVDVGANFYNVNSLDQTALHVAVLSEKERLEKVRYLIALDKSILHAVDERKRTCVHSAARRGNIDCIYEFLKHGAPILTQRTRLEIHLSVTYCSTISTITMMTTSVYCKSV